jgi:hypothetical protein
LVDDEKFFILEKLFLIPVEIMLSLNPCKNKKTFNGVFSGINTKTGVK